MSTKIEYADETINPIRTKAGGWYCVKSSTGCSNCYAEKINKRFGDGHSYTKRDVELVLNEKALEKPLKWKKSKRIFIQDMSDLFLPVNGEYFNRVQHQAHCRIIDLIKETSWHTYLMLTKHPKEMALSFLGTSGPDFWHEPLHFENGKPLPNLWLGITAENQEMFDKRWAFLRQIPAAVYMISYEPALGPLVLPPDFLALGKRAWIVCGMESLGGWPGRSFELHIHHIAALKNQCVEAGVPFFLKQINFNGKLLKMPKLDLKHWNQMPGRV